MVIDTPPVAAPTQGELDVPGVPGVPTAPAAPTASAAPAAPEPPRTAAPISGPPRPKPMAILLSALMVLSVTAVFLGAFALGLQGLQEQRSQDQLYAAFRGLVDPSSPVAPSIGGVIPPGSPVALLNAPAAGVHDVVVVEGTSSGELQNGPGHLADTPLPGQPGQSILVGKSTTAGAPFEGITRLRRGDVVTVRTGQGRFRYVVTGRLVAGERPPPVRADSGLLTLVTAAGRGGPTLDPGRVVYVDATLQGKAVTAPPGRPKTVPAPDLPGHGDPGAWPWVVAWGVALVIATVACWWAWFRWGILRTWLIGAPILLAVLWGLGNGVTRLFPNVY